MLQPIWPRAGQQPRLTGQANRTPGSGAGRKARATPGSLGVVTRGAQGAEGRVSSTNGNQLVDRRWPAAGPAHASRVWRAPVHFKWLTILAHRPGLFHII